nr:hypothetical protein [Tanacetum cinerariifolium]
NKPKPASEKVYTYVEQMPQLPGGGRQQAIANDFFKRLNLPKSAIEQGYNRSAVFFEVGSDGLVRHVRIVHSSNSPALDSAILATVRSFPRFIPGRQNGKAVAEMGFHVDFKVDIPANHEAEDAFFDKLFDFVDEHDLSIGGSMSSFYVSRDGRNTTTNADREAMAAWLQQQPEVSAVKFQSHSTLILVMEVSNKPTVKGGEFIIKATEAQDVFTPADFSEEQNMMYQTCLDFVQTEVHPLVERLDNHEEGLMRGLMEKAGQLGLFGVSVPEEFGGLNMDFPTALRVTEGVGGGNSFPVAFAAHTGIALLPIL